MSLIPHFFGRRSNIYDPFALDLSDSFEGWPFNSNFRLAERGVTSRRTMRDTWHRVECSSSKFMRRFRLPENAKVDQVKAAMENGVLNLTVPKEEVQKPDVKSIKISG